MATNTGQIMTLANSIIGVSVLAMPFCFKQCGITLAILMLILSSIISRLACHYVVKSSIMCRRRNFEFLAFYSFGPSGKLLVELGVIGFMMGTCVAFFVVMGDLGPEIVSKLFTISNNSTLRSSVLLGIGLFIVLPLGLLKNVESLAAVSTITIGFYLILVMKIFSESFPHLIAGDWMDQVNFWRPEGVLQCVPIFAMALSCQTQIFEIYDSLPNPSLEKINYVVRNAVNICTAVYISVGFLGYIAFSTANFSGNVLLSFSSTMSSELCKLGFVLSIAVSFPLVIFPCRASLYSLLFRKMPIHHELSQTSTHIPDSRFKCLTLGIVAVSLTTGLLIPSIELVLGFVGSTIGIAICVIFPSLVFIKMTNKDTNERLMAKVTLMLGLVIMVTGTYGNLYAANEGRPIDTVYEKQIPADVKLPPKPDFNSDVVKVVKKDEANAIIAVAENKPSDVIEPALVDKAGVGKPIEASPEKPIPSQPQIPAKPIILEEVKREPVKEKPMDVAPLKVQPDDNKEVNKIHEVINKDAIEKEEKELQEAEKQRKSVEEQKQEELRKILKEHQDEQKKLLQEQEKILKEFKDREKENKQNEVVKEESVKKSEKEVIVEDVKPIKSEEFKKNIDTIQNVIDDLKDTKQAIEKEKMEVKAKIKEEVPEAKPPDPKPEPEKVLPNLEIKSKIPSVPIPLALLQNNLGAKKSEEVKSKQEALGRDILGSKNILNALHRDKRDVKPGEDGSEECPAKTESSPVDKKEMNITTETKNNTIHSNDTKILNSPDSEIIKTSEQLSIPVVDDSKLKISDDTVPADPNLSMIPKKRDLKSVESRDEKSG